jgi:hypothetical protein
MGRSFEFLDFSMMLNRLGTTLHLFNVMVTKGCRISPPDLAIVAVVHAAQLKL